MAIPAFNNNGDLPILESVDEFVAHWQLKRDLTRRGIVEIVEA